MSDNKIAELLTQEVQDLERQLANSPVYRKLVKARALLDEYGIATETKATVVGKSLDIRRSIPTNEILDVAETVVRRGNGSPVRTSQIYDALREQAVNIPGKEPRNTLSARLSNSNRFISHGRQGWTMANDSADADAEKAEAVDDSFSSTASIELGQASQGITYAPSNGHLSPEG